MIFLFLYCSENTIAVRDLVAFAAESEDDANLLLKQFRDGMKLRANVITVKCDEGLLNTYLPDETNLEYFNKRKQELDFKGYLSEMFTAPTTQLSAMEMSLVSKKVPFKAVGCQTVSMTTA